jgi:Protein of unknown function (DUF3034)
MKVRGIALFAAAGIAFAASPAFAEGPRGGGKLLLTDGISSAEGASGGGLAAWATIAGNETDAGIGATAHLTYASLSDFDLIGAGVSAGFYDRVELSYAHHDFDTRKAGAALGLGRGFSFRQDIFGVKLRLFGDAVYDQDSVLPQVAVGVQYKRAAHAGLIGALGGRSNDGVDFYIAATKIFLAQSLVVNATARLTKANHLGLLGFGGDKQGGYTLQFEGSAGYLVSKRLLIGGEYRTMPDNLAFAKEDDAFDAFAAYALTRNITLTAAYADMGSIATFKNQRGGLVSVQAGF